MVLAAAGANYFFDEFSSDLAVALRLLMTHCPTCADGQDVGPEPGQLPVPDTGDDDQLALAVRCRLRDGHQCLVGEDAVGGLADLLRPVRAPLTQPLVQRLVHVR